MQRKVLWSVLATVVAGAFWLGFGRSERKVAAVRYLDDMFGTIKVRKDVQYGAALGAKGANEILYLDVYFAQGDTAKKRWAILYVHGGGFFAGDKGSSSAVSLCTALARKGYVVLSLNYRLLGFVPDESTYEQGIELGAADVRAAIRFARANNEMFRIDPERIAVYGGSAGGGHVDGVYNQAYDSSNVSTPGTSGDPNAVAESSGPVSADVGYIEPGEWPLYIVHSPDDSTVAFSHAQRLAAQAQAAGIDYATWFPAMSGDCAHALLHPLCAQNEIIISLTNFIYWHFIF